MPIFDEDAALLFEDTHKSIASIIAQLKHFTLRVTNFQSLSTQGSCSPNYFSTKFIESLDDSAQSSTLSDLCYTLTSLNQFILAYSPFAGTELFIEFDLPEPYRFPCLHAHELALNTVLRIAENISSDFYDHQDNTSLPSQFTSRHIEAYRHYANVLTRADTLITKEWAHINSVTPPTNSAAPSLPHTSCFLDLTVDELNRTVKRPRKPNLTLSKLQWQIFIVAYRAGEHGATKQAILNNFDGDRIGKALDAAKHRLRVNLQGIGLSLEKGSGAKLVIWDGN